MYDNTILPWFQTPSRKFAECIPNLKKKNVRVIMLLYLQGRACLNT